MARLLANVLYEMEQVLRELPQRRFLAEYRSRSCLIGKTVELTKDDGTVKKVAVLEIADALSMDVADVILAFEANQFVYSLDETIYENDGSPILLEDKVSNRKEEDVVMKVSLQNEIAHLEQREQLLLHYRYDLGMKQEEIAKKLQISQVQVSRLEKKILLKLKERLMVT